LKFPSNCILLWNSFVLALKLLPFINRLFKRKFQNQTQTLSQAIHPTPLSPLQQCIPKFSIPVALQNSINNKWIKRCNTRIYSLPDFNMDLNAVSNTGSFNTFWLGLCSHRWILRHIHPLISNDRETNNEKTANTSQQLRNTQQYWSNC
jgi:hypothetical protein